MASLIIEGTWEEIQRHAGRLSGHQVRLTVLDNAGDRPNDRMLRILENARRLQEKMRYTDRSKTQNYLRDARDGGLFGE